MKSALRLGLTVAALTFSLRAVPQQAVPPPPKPADAGPTLPATMAFLQNKLSDLTDVTLESVVHVPSSDRDNPFTQIVTVFKVSVAACHIKYSYQSSSPSSPGPITTQDLDLAHAEDVVVESWQRHMNREWAGGVKTTSVNPADTVALSVRGPYPDGSPHKFGDAFPFTDPNIADRVAKAFTHAIELCGGGSKDAF